MGYLLDENTICLLHCDEISEQIKDYTNNAYLKNTQNIAVVEDGKFNKAYEIGYSTQSNLYFNNSISSYLTNTKIYTVDFWLKIPVKNPNYYILRTSSSQTSYLDVQISCSTTSYTFTVNSTTIATVNKEDIIGQYVHFAISSDGTITYCFINGVLMNTVSSKNLCSSSHKYLYFAKPTGSIENLIIDEFRISNVCRYTEDFTPNKRPYGNPTYPNVLNSTELLCSIINEITLDKLEVYVNDVLDKTYNSLNANTITIHRYNLDLLETENNLIKVIGYKDNLDYPVEFKYKYLPPLSSIASLNTIINRLQSLLERQENENSIFRSILKSKGITDDLDGLRYEELMEYVRLLGDYDENNTPTTQTITITSVSEVWGTAYINVSSGLVDDEPVDLYIDDVFKNTYYYRSGQVQTISTSVILNKTIQLKTTDGRVSNKYYVESFS